AADPALKSSREPEKGCRWEKLSGSGVEFLAPVCDFGYETTHMFQKDASFFEVLHDTSGARKDTVNQLIWVYSKAAEETPEAAIKRIAFPSLTAYQREHCGVKSPGADVPLSSGAVTYTIAADKVYQAKIDKESAGDIPEPPCGLQGF